MATDYNLPHIDISGLAQSRSYQAPTPGRGAGTALRVREEHGAKLSQELHFAFSQADQHRIEDERLPPPTGTYVEVELMPGKDPGSLERGPPKRSDQETETKVKPGATKLEDNQRRTVALYVPDEQRDVLERIITEYTTGDLTEGGNPPNKSYLDGIESIRQARLETFWTDAPEALPRASSRVIWWEVWCFKGSIARFERAAQAVGVHLGNREHWLTFPETIIVPVLTDRVTIELLLFADSGIAELRRASATPTFFLEAAPEEQLQWSGELAERVIWPGSDAPAICLLDTGVNRAHALLEPALAPGDLSSVHPDWGAADSEGHGTEMAGIALHGDLTSRLQDMAESRLTHRLESVKLLPPRGFRRADPQSYGAITQAAVSLPEIENAGRSRIFCMAVTNQGVAGSRTTTWSAAIDQAAAGTMSGEPDEPRRLFVLATGNAPPSIETADIRPIREHPIEDPAQSWNALTVGGVTDKIIIDDDGFGGWKAMVDAGDVSPFSRSSLSWPSSGTPYKPDIVMEAGNRAIRPDGKEALSLDSLAVLTTGAQVGTHPLVPFRATSAATAEAARLAARLTAQHPAHWPETVRALIVHSAEWTKPMRAALSNAGGVRERQPLLRVFGYGVPNFERAAQSAQNHLAILAQREIQPYKSQGRRFNECHYYPLPWPREILEQLNNHIVRLRITLSYFVDPNPGASATIYPMRYQSFGLRFDLRRSRETVEDFVQRVNAADRENPKRPGSGHPDDGRWMFGPMSVSAGSLHCDEWNGPAIELADRNLICIKPVGGWWRDRASPEVANGRGRYALVVTLEAPDVEVELHARIAAAVATGIGIEVPIGGVSRGEGEE